MAAVLTDFLDTKSSQSVALIFPTRYAIWDCSLCANILENHHGDAKEEFLAPKKRLWSCGDMTFGYIFVPFFWASVIYEVHLKGSVLQKEDYFDK